MAKAVPMGCLACKNQLTDCYILIFKDVLRCGWPIAAVDFAVLATVFRFNYDIS
jgi:hypothetical protein